jgi:hypothetical protein
MPFFYLGKSENYSGWKNGMQDTQPAVHSGSSHHAVRCAEPRSEHVVASASEGQVRPPNSWRICFQTSVWLVCLAMTATRWPIKLLVRLDGARRADPLLHSCWFSAAGYLVQSLRIVTNPFGEYLDCSSADAALADLAVLVGLLNSLSGACNEPC